MESTSEKSINISDQLTAMYACMGFNEVYINMDDEDSVAMHNKHDGFSALLKDLADCVPTINAYFTEHSEIDEETRYELTEKFGERYALAVIQLGYMPYAPNPEAVLAGVIAMMSPPESDGRLAPGHTR